MNTFWISKYLNVLGVIIIYSSSVRTLAMPLTVHGLCITLLKLFHGNYWVNRNGNVFAYINMHLWIRFHQYFMYKFCVKGFRYVYFSSSAVMAASLVTSRGISIRAIKYNNTEKRSNIQIFQRCSLINDVL